METTATTPAEIATVMKGNARYRNAVLTAWEKPNEEAIKQACEYFIGQAEYTKTGNLHYQMYAEFKNQLSLKQIKAIFGQKTHIERRYGSQMQAIEYCRKIDSKCRDENAYEFEFGTPKEQGKRTDLSSMVDAIKCHVPTWDIIEAHGGNGLRHVNHIIKCQKIFYGIDKEANNIDSARVFALALRDAKLAEYAKETIKNLNANELQAVQAMDENIKKNVDVCVPAIKTTSMKDWACNVEEDPWPEFTQQAHEIQIDAETADNFNRMYESVIADESTASDTDDLETFNRFRRRLFDGEPLNNDATTDDDTTDDD